MRIIAKEKLFKNVKHQLIDDTMLYGIKHEHFRINTTHFEVIILLLFL